MTKQPQKPKAQPKTGPGRGGYRPGGGRPKGSVSKRTQELTAAIMKSEGLTPLEYMLQVLRDKTAKPADRMWAAQTAAPYLHPRLQAQVNSLDPSKPPVTRMEVTFVGG